MRARNDDFERQHAIGLKAEVDVLKALVCANQQQRAGQQHHADGQLGDHEHRTGGHGAARRAGGPGVRSQRIVEPRAGRLQRRNEADGHPHEKDEGTGVRTAVPSIAIACDTGSRRGYSERRPASSHFASTTPATPPAAARSIASPASCRIRRQQFAPSASHGELAPPGFPIRHQQRRDIDADDQQDERCRPAEQNPRVAVIADDVVLQRAADGEVPSGVMLRVGR